MDSPPSWPLVLLFLLLLAIVPFSAGKTFPVDIAALEALKRAVDTTSAPPGSCLATWDFFYDPCDSAAAADSTAFTCGLLCSDDSTVSDKHRHVTDISLDHAGYSGSLSLAVWSLSSLQTLDLAGNRFSGDLPPPISGEFPPLLRRITLSRNAFTGEVPTLSSAQALEELYLDGNLLSGQVPSSISCLKSLRRLSLGSNRFSGELPDLSALTQLEFLDAGDNLITGSFNGLLPASLTVVSLRNNKLAGSLPAATLTSLPEMEVLDLSNNAISGEVPSAAFEHPSLQQLSLAGNQLDGVDQPDDGGLSSSLVAIDFSRNRLTGEMPWFFAAMPRLSALTLENNRLTGVIPAAYAVRAVAAAAYGGVVPYSRLLLAGNYLYGPVPLTLMTGGGGGGVTALVSLADNCFFRCPEVFFVCRGARQKPLETCRRFNPFMPWIEKNI